MSVLLSKVWYDLWHNKARTFQVVLVIAIGAIGIGLVIGGRNLIAGTIADQWRQANPPNIKLAVTPPLTEAQLRRLERIQGVAQAEGILSATVEWRFPGEAEWRTARLEGRDDFRQQKMELTALISGQWPGRNTLGVVKSADTLYGVNEGDTIEVRVGETTRSYLLSGTLKPVGPFPVVFLGIPVFYADGNTFSRLTGRNNYNLVQTQDTSFDLQRAEATDLQIQAYFEDIGVDSVGTLFPFQDRIISPDVPPAAELLNAIFLLLGLIGAITVVLGVFLVNNSVSAIITQQINQIGVMKAIGARPGQVLYSYLLLIFGYGVLAALVSIPVGGLAARGLQSLFINLLNLVDPGFSLDPAAVSVQVAISLLAPLLAALLPLRGGLQITVREAISSYGLNGTVGLLDRLIARLKQIPYTLLLIFGNAFRNRRRVFFIELTLVVAGMIFMMVVGVNDATQFTFGDKLTSIHKYQVGLSFANLERVQLVERLAQSDQRVQAQEGWLVASAKARPVSQKDSAVTDARVSLYGLPAQTTLYNPQLVAGRWLDPQDTYAVVIHQRLADVKGWQVGQWITLETNNGGEEKWRIVGVVYDPLASAGVFVPLKSVQRELGASGQINALWIQSSVADAAGQEALAVSLTEAFERRNVDVNPGGVFRYNTITRIVEETSGSYDLIIQLLTIMAVVIALVGGVGLSGVLTLNVLERRREIGVMRSIGASNWRIIRIFVGEGMLLGWLSYAIALPLSIPAAYFLATQGLSFALGQQLAYRFTPTGALAWLAIVSGLAIIASVFPARGAAKVSVRESLAYQ